MKRILNNWFLLFKEWERSKNIPSSIIKYVLIDSYKAKCFGECSSMKVKTKDNIESVCEGYVQLLPSQKFFSHDLVPEPLYFVFDKVTKDKQMNL